MDKLNNANNNCRFCLRIFDEMEERVGITSQISDEFRNITQSEVSKKNTNNKFSIVNVWKFRILNWYLKSDLSQLSN